MDFEYHNLIEAIKSKGTKNPKASKSWSLEDSSVPSLESRNWFRRTAGSCPICGEQHLFRHKRTGEQLISALLHICPIYEQARVEVQLEMIEWNEACLVCTDHRHTEANCAWNTTKPCNVRACYERHHISLHQTVTGRINVIQVIDLTLTDSLLPVMIYTFKDQEQTTTILFDSGSTVSLIEKSCQLPWSQRFPSDYYPVQSLQN